MITVYVVLDGFDLGAGMVHLFAAREDSERRLILKSIGPVWDGNEVWLLAGGGVLFFAFPVLYASAFSGFYLPLMIVLWLLILRGISIEFRNHLRTPIWGPFWDVVFAGASGLLAVFFGAALGNVVRGVPVNEQGEFFLPLWTDFTLQGEVGILDWYTVLTGVLAAFTLATHGALWVVYKTSGPVQERARRCAMLGWRGTAALALAVTAVTFMVQPRVPASFQARPWSWVFPALAMIGLAGVYHYVHRRDKDLRAFLSSCLFIAALLVSAALGVYPYMLPSNLSAELGLTIYNASTAAYGLKVGLGWFIPGILLTTGYFVYIYRRLAGKVSLEDNGAH